MKLVSAESSEKKRKGAIYTNYIACCLHANPQNWKRQLCNGDQTKRFRYVSGVQSHSMFEGDVTTVACAAQSCAKSAPSFFCSVKHVSVITIDCTNSFLPPHTHTHTYTCRSYCLRYWPLGPLVCCIIQKEKKTPGGF